MEFPTTMAAALVVVLMILPFSVSGQAACAQKLVPCASYMNVTSPPPSCCEPLKEAITNDLPCLCDLYNAPGFFKSLNINETDALTLPTRCKLTNDLSSCSKASSPTNSASQQPPPGTSGNSGYVVGAESWTVVLSCAVLFFSLNFH